MEGIYQTELLHQPVVYVYINVIHAQVLLQIVIAIVYLPQQRRDKELLVIVLQLDIMIKLAQLIVNHVKLLVQHALAH